MSLTPKLSERERFAKVSRRESSFSVSITVTFVKQNLNPASIPAEFLVEAGRSVKEFWVFRLSIFFDVKMKDPTVCNKSVDHNRVVGGIC